MPRSSMSRMVKTPTCPVTAEAAGSSAVGLAICGEIELGFIASDDVHDSSFRQPSFYHFHNLVVG